MLARALPVMREIVVAHAGERCSWSRTRPRCASSCAACSAFDARGYRDRLDQSPACLNVVDFKDPVRARLMLFNDISHYRDRPAHRGAHLSKWWDAGPERPHGD